MHATQEHNCGCNEYFVQRRVTHPHEYVINETYFTKISCEDKEQTEISQYTSQCDCKHYGPLDFIEVGNS
jgi:hypothetical protein